MLIAFQVKKLQETVSIEEQLDVIICSWKKVNELLTYDNVRLAHNIVCAIRDDADGIRDSAKCWEIVKCQQSKRGIVCLCS
jgi:hypothetical protein